MKREMQSDKEIGFRGPTRAFRGGEQIGFKGGQIGCLRVSKKNR